MMRQPGYMRFRWPLQSSALRAPKSMRPSQPSAFSGPTC